MSRLLIVAFVSAFTSVALACGDNANCTNAACQMKHTSTTAAAPLPDGTKGVLNVTGMKCGACADKVTAALMKVDGVKGAHVDAAGGKAEISFDEKKTNLDALVKAVNGSGFVASVAPPPAPTAPGTH